MRILYIFPHPDDESFGPARALSKQQREGHEVYLLTLTRGGATKQRHRLGLSVEEMGEVRYKEMLQVEKVLGLGGMTVLDLPDSGLKAMDPREIESVVAHEIRRVTPDVVVTYAVHGVSGFHDHLVGHAVVKRVFVELKDELRSLVRLAFFTIAEDHAKDNVVTRLSGSTPDEIDCVIHVEAVDIERNNDALDCYVTYRETIERSGVKDSMGTTVAFEFYQESFDPPVDDIFAGISS